MWNRGPYVWDGLPTANPPAKAVVMPDLYGIWAGEGRYGFTCPTCLGRMEETGISAYVEIHACRICGRTISVK